MTYQNLSVILELVNDAFNLEGLNTFCFINFRSVYDQFQETDRKNTRVRMLVEYADQHGQLGELLARIKTENPGKYAQYTNKLGSAVSSIQTSDSVSSSVFNQSGQQVGTQYNVAGNLTIHSEKNKGDDEEEK